MSQTKSKLSSKSPYTDGILTTLNLVTNSGKQLRDTITETQRQIAEIILTKQSPDGKNRIHITAHTRYGKSQTIGSATAVRAALKQERWAIVAPTKEQAQIIMDYVIQTITNDPLLRKYIDTKLYKSIEVERLTSRRSRDHITFIGGGEVRTYHVGGTMGFGCPNVILDEAGLISNAEEAKIFRMLGDDIENSFYIKVGNPWASMDVDGQEHHFYASYTDSAYYQLDITWETGLREGRVTQSYIDEVKKKPFFGVLYENTFPKNDGADSKGYMALLSHDELKKATVAPGTVEPKGLHILGADPADEGDNESVIARRYLNLLQIIHHNTTTDSRVFAFKLLENVKRDTDQVNVDKQGIGAGTYRILKASGHAERINGVNSGLPVPDNVRDGDQKAKERYENLRAYVFWQMREWILAGGKIEDDGTLNLRQILAVRYKHSSKGKIKIITKDELRAREVKDLGIADAISYTFIPRKPDMSKQRVTGGVDPLQGAVQDIPRESDWKKVSRGIQDQKVIHKPYFPDIPTLPN